MTGTKGHSGGSRPGAGRKPDVLRLGQRYIVTVSQGDVSFSGLLQMECTDLTAHSATLRGGLDGAQDVTIVVLQR